MNLSGDVFELTPLAFTIATDDTSREWFTLHAQYMLRAHVKMLHSKSKTLLVMVKKMLPVTLPVMFCAHIK